MYGSARKLYNFNIDNVSELLTNEQINLKQLTYVQSWTFDEYTNSEIRRAAETGIYDIRGGGSKRKLPHFDDLLFLGASMSRYPLWGI